MQRMEVVYGKRPLIQPATGLPRQTACGGCLRGNQWLHQQQCEQRTLWAPGTRNRVTPAQRTPCQPSYQALVSKGITGGIGCKFGSKTQEDLLHGGYWINMRVWCVHRGDWRSGGVIYPQQVSSADDCHVQPTNSEPYRKSRSITTGIPTFKWTGPITDFQGRFYKETCPCHYRRPNLAAAWFPCVYPLSLCLSVYKASSERRHTLQCESQGLFPRFSTSSLPLLFLSSEPCHPSRITLSIYVPYLQPRDS